MTIEPGAATAVRAPRPEKVAVVEDVRSRLSASSAAILTEYRGLHVSHMAELRRALAPIGGSYKVYKNTLVRRAAEETGFGALSALLEGPTAIAFVDGDVAAVAKVLREFSRTHPALVVKGGLIGTSLLDSRGAQALADLPSREVLLAQIAGALAAPMQKFAALLAAVPQKMAYGLKALIDARVAAGEAPPPVAASPAPEEVAASAVTGGEAAPPAAAPTEDVAAEETVPAETSSAEETVPAETSSAEETVPAETVPAETSSAEDVAPAEGAASEGAASEGAEASSEEA